MIKTPPGLAAAAFLREQHRFCVESGLTADDDDFKTAWNHRWARARILGRSSRAGTKVRGYEIDAIGGGIVGHGTRAALVGSDWMVL